MFEFFVGLAIAITIAMIVASAILVVGIFSIILNKKFLCWYVKKIVMVSETLSNGDWED